MPVQIYRLEITGKVQGVFYRQSTWQKAQQLGVYGYARNCADGSVEVLVIAPEETARQLVEFCRSGPPHARVDNLDLTGVPLEQLGALLARCPDAAAVYDLQNPAAGSFIILRDSAD